jgi:short-subunit dehydrogenase
MLPAPDHAGYSASKAWLHQLVCSLQAERLRHPITLTLACPGGMATPMLLDSPAWTRLRHNPLVRASVLAPDRAARQMLAAMDAGRWLVVPGWINRATLLLCRFLPRALAIYLSGWLYRPDPDQAPLEPPESPGDD